jgi:hypothetical protein
LLDLMERGSGPAVDRIAAALIAVHIVEHSNRSLVIGIGASSALEMIYPVSSMLAAKLLDYYPQVGGVSFKHSYK